ncbi:hypothetical protein N7470_001363 [Penicillium chermesinum]|nr:hypothetical protein N7470_001363 [Penicillium chermesinum]
MPPIQSDSAQESADQEAKVLAALDDLKNGRFRSLGAAAKRYKIPASIHYVGGPKAGPHAWNTPIRP